MASQQRFIAAGTTLCNLPLQPLSSDGNFASQAGTQRELAHLECKVCTINTAYIPAVLSIVQVV